MRSFLLLSLFTLFHAVPAAAQVSECGFDECSAANSCTVLLCTTLDNAAETAVPDVGPSARALTTLDFVQGFAGRGLLADAVGEFVAYPQVGLNSQGAMLQSIEISQGTLDFWYQPFYDESDPGEYFIFTNARRRLVGTNVVTVPGSLEVLKHSSLGNGNAMAINYWDGVATEVLPGGLVVPKRWEFWIYPSDYELRFGVFTHFRITWDWSSTGVPVRVWQDGRELPLDRADGGPPWTGPMGVAPESPAESIYICGRPAGTGGALFQYNGVCDHVRIYDQAVAPLRHCGMGPELAVILPILAWARSRRKRAQA